MQQIHVQEKEQLKKLFDQEGVDHLEERINILEVFLQTEKHLSAAELVDLLCCRADGAGVVAVAFHERSPGHVDCRAGRA